MPDLIPVARIADLLLNPGQTYDFNGARLTYPDIRLVYWAGGNPFHHHQDLNRLRQAFSRPDTVIVHDSAWSASARHADIVFPATVTLERSDLGAAGNDPLLVAMHPVAEPFGQARDDYAIFVDLAERLGVAERFTEGRSVEAWLRHLYEPTRAALQKLGHDAPDFDAFWKAGELVLPTEPWDGGVVRAFRRDPAQRKLHTPTGRMEITSATIAGFGYDDCPGHPVWLPPVEGAGSPLMRAFPAASGGESAGGAAAQSAGFRRDQHGIESQRSRARAHTSAGRGIAADRRRRGGAGIQPSGCLPGRGRDQRGCASGRGAACHRRLV